MCGHNKKHFKAKKHFYWQGNLVYHIPPSTDEIQYKPEAKFQLFKKDKTIQLYVDRFEINFPSNADAKFSSGSDQLNLYHKNKPYKIPKCYRPKKDISFPVAFYDQGSPKIIYLNIKTDGTINLFGPFAFNLRSEKTQYLPATCVDYLIVKEKEKHDK